MDVMGISSYLRSLHRADHGVDTWDLFKIVFEMSGNTTMIVAPEHGRNDDPNGIKDANAFYGYDHSDSNSQRIFNMMVGPGVDSNLSIGNENNKVGDIVNIAPTIADIRI